MTERAWVLAIVVTGCITEPDRPCPVPRYLPELHEGEDFSPRLSPDRKEMVFTGKTANGYGVYRATRNTATGTFTMPVLVKDHTGTDDAFDGLTSPDGKLLWWLVGSGTSGGFIHEAMRDASATSGFSGDTLRFPELGQVLHPTITNDLLHMFYSKKVGDNFELYTSSRADDKSAFGGETMLVGLDTDGDDAGASISGDGTVLYFNSPRFSDAADSGNNIAHIGFATRVSGFTDPQPLATIPAIAGKEDLMGGVDLSRTTFVFSSKRTGGPSDGYGLWIACE